MALNDDGDIVGHRPDGTSIVLIIPEKLAVERVLHRVQAGGHAVPPDKIRQRHRRPWSLVADAVAQISGGDVIGSPSWPAWAPRELTSGWSD